MSEPVAYEGLSWNRGKRALCGARSDFTPHIYTVQAAAEEMLAFAGFEGQEGKLRLGRFRDLELAMLACERHDFEYFAAQVESDDLVPFFQGSKRTQNVAKVLQEAAPGEDLADLLSDAPRLPSGRPFHRAASFFEARKEALKQNSDGSWTIPLVIKAREIPNWLRDAPKGTQLSLGAVALTEGTPEEDLRWQERHRDAFTRAHLLPQDSSFQEWLAQRYDHWGLLRTALAKDSDSLNDATLETLKRLLGVPSRRDLQTDRDAVNRLEDLDRQFYQDMRMGMNHPYPAKSPS